jgi:CIC family chloride channel protein
VSQFLPVSQTGGQVFMHLDHMLHPQDPLATVIQRLGESPHTALPVVDQDKRLLGVVSLDEVYLASQSPSLQTIVLATDLMRGDVQPLTPDDTLDRALELFVENDMMTVPVVTNLADRCLLGMVSRFDISSAYLRLVHGPGES